MAPEAGDKIRGDLVAGPSWRKAEFGAYPIYTLALIDGYEARTKDGTLVTGEIAVHASRDVLERKLANAKLGLGDQVGVKYQGPPIGTARAHRYRVVKYLPDGVEVPYEPDDELDAPDEDDGATQMALEAERDEREQAVSDAEATRLLHEPLDNEGAVS